jgi:hypothetical protein
MEMTWIGFSILCGSGTYWPLLKSTFIVNVVYMETLIINVPDQKSSVVKRLLKELGVTIQNKSKATCRRNKCFY